MIIHILNYKNEKIPVEVPDGTTTVSGKVVTGDMILTDPPYNVDYEGKTEDALKIEKISISY